jgi:membrane-bound ClpP family serine protease
MAGLSVALFLLSVGLAVGSVIGPLVVVWLAAAAMLILVVTTAVISAHAGGHAWFVPLPGALLALAWLVAVSGGARHATAWWLLAASAAFTGVAVIMAAGILRARVVARSLPAPTLVGQAGTTVSALTPVGIARVQGETWTAESISGSLPAGAPVHVVRVEGLRLLVWSEQGQVPGPEILPGHSEPEQSGRSS